MTNWQESLVIETASIRDAIAAIDGGGSQIAIVTDSQQHILGTVTDGDVRRAILSGTDLDSPVADIMHRAPTVARSGDSRDTILGLMRAKLLHQIPLVDAQGRIAGLETIDDLFKRGGSDNWVVLMAGGPGIRLRPLTETTPKPMLEVGSKPLLETILETLIGYDFQRFYIAVNYKAEMVMERIGDGSRWGVDVGYIEEDKRLGTAGALAHLPAAPTAPLLVMNGDLLTNLNFRHLLTYHAEQGCRATMCVREYATQMPYGVVDVENQRVTSIKEKPVQRNFINAGIYVLEPEVVADLPKDTALDMTSVLEAIVREGGDVAVFPIREFWLDIGQHEDYASAADHYDRLFK